MAARLAWTNFQRWTDPKAEADKDAMLHAILGSNPGRDIGNPLRKWRRNAMGNDLNVDVMYAFGAYLIVVAHSFTAHSKLL